MSPPCSSNARHVLFDYDFRKFARELTFNEPADWLDFVHSILPKLREPGWRIDTDDSFRFRLARTARMQRKLPRAHALCSESGLFDKAPLVSPACSCCVEKQRDEGIKQHDG